MGWRFDVENAPRGRSKTVSGPKGSTRQVHVPEVIILASADGQTVTLSRWLPDENRWNMLGKKETPVAWQPFPTYPEVLTDTGQ
jgi:hypothetical protein